MKGSIERVLGALNAADVRYVVVGGVAVVLHGYLRTTADLDLVIQLDSENVRRAIRALESIGYRSRLPVSAEQLADADARRSWIEDKGMVVFSLWSEHDPFLGVDLFVEEPFDFDAVHARAVRVRLERETIVVVAREDLIRLKEQAGRPRDVEDVTALRALAEPPEESDG